MKKKIPFEFDLKDQIESGAIEVVTKADKPVRILCYDAVGNYPIVALVKPYDNDFEEVHRYDLKGVEESVNCTSCGMERFNLFLLIDDPNTTEFEDYVDKIVDPEESRKVGDSRIIAKKLLELAEKELEKKFHISSYQEGYDQGFSEGRSAILEKMPIWKKTKPTKDGNFLLHFTGGYVETSDWRESEGKFYYEDGESYLDIGINDRGLLGWIYSEELENLYSE